MESFDTHNGLHWLYLYLILGVVIALIFLLSSLRDRPSRSAAAMIAAVSNKSLRRIDLEDLFIYSIAIIGVTLAWPIFLVWAAIQKIQEKRTMDQVDDDEDGFCCEPQFLVKKVTPLEAEKANMINDPLGMTPNLPFGHFNQAWSKFLADFGFDQDSELWYFEIPKGSKTKKYFSPTEGKISGYAKVVNGKVLNEFLLEGDW